MEKNVVTDNVSRKGKYPFVVDHGTVVAGGTKYLKVA